MTPRASAVASHKPAQSLSRVPLAIVAVLLAVGLSQYLAGYFLVWSLHAPLHEAGILTAARYAYYYGDQPAVRGRILLSSAAGLLLVAAAAGAALWPRARALHGDARFASWREIAATGLLGPRGIILGRLGGRYLMLAGQQGVALAAPPRAGKGVGVVIPNLLNWPDSVIVTDVKKENWAVTAGYRRSRGHIVHLFDPLSARTARWNPFTYVPAQPDLRIDGVQKIADMFYTEIPGTDPFWIASARSLFVGIGLYLLETPSLPATIGEVRRQGMASDDEGFAHHWKRIIEGRNSGRFPLSDECVRALYDVIDLAPVTASSIRKTFTSRLDLWANPLLDRATSGNDFDLRDLRKVPMSLYVGVNPDDLHRLRPLLSLFFQQAIGLQTQSLPEHDPTLRCQLLLLLDEFAALGRIPIISEAASYLPGYNVRLVLIFQALSQLREVYGPHASATMLKSLAARIVFAPKDYDEAKEISEELGDCTVRARAFSRPRFAQWGRRPSGQGGQVTLSEQRRPLLLPQEVKELGKEEALLFYEGLRPIRCRKLRYYEERRFRRRLLPPPAQPIAPDATLRSAPKELSVDAPERAAAEGRPAEPQGAQAQNAERSPGHLTEAHNEPILREPTLDDLPRLESLTLADFGGNYDRITASEGHTATESEIQAEVEQFLAGLNVPREL
jgi:type IV secretion system protein VirD4